MADMRSMDSLISLAACLETVSSGLSWVSTDMEADDSLIVIVDSVSDSLSLSILPESIDLMEANCSFMSPRLSSERTVPGLTARLIAIFLSPTSSSADSSSCFMSWYERLPLRKSELSISSGLSSLEAGESAIGCAAAEPRPSLLLLSMFAL